LSKIKLIVYLHTLWKARHKSLFKLRFYEKNISALEEKEKKQTRISWAYGFCKRT